MCGIVGSIGISTNHLDSHRISTALLKETERRGNDATGFYSIDINGHAFYYKINRPAKNFVRMRPWRSLRGLSKIFIGHTRWTTHGDEANNLNNHPHVSDDGKIAIVHNGIITSYETLKIPYKDKIVSQCDSELILRIVEDQLNKGSDIISAIKEVYKVCKYGTFACELSHYDTNTRKAHLYLFKSFGRPIKFIDLSSHIGQYFFCSEKQIWEDTVKRRHLSQYDNANIVDIPSYEIWKIDPETLEIEKIDVETQGLQTTYKYTYPSTYTGNYNYPIVPSSTTPSTYYDGYPWASKIPTTINTIQDDLASKRTLMYDSSKNKKALLMKELGILEAFIDNMETKIAEVSDAEFDKTIEMINKIISNI